MGPALPFIAIGLTVASGAMQAVGQAKQAQSQASAANYNAQVAQQNAKISLQNARLASEAGNTQVETSQLKTRALTGSIKANQGASGVDIGSGSFVDVQNSARVLGQEDALNIRANAVKEAYGYQTQAQGYEQKAGMDQAEAKNAITAGNIAVAGTLLGTAGSATSKWEQYQLQGAMGGSTSSSSSFLVGD